MQLVTKVIAQSTLQLEKELQCYFDHDVQLVPRVCSKYNKQCDLSAKQILNHLLIDYQMNPKKNHCVLAYKLQLELNELRKIVLNINGQSKWSAKIFQYDPKTKRVVLKEESLLYEQKQQRLIEMQSKLRKNQENTYILQLQHENEDIIRVYFLPFSKARKEEETQLTRAIHQNFKLIRIIKQYVSLQCSCDTPLIFQEEIFNNLTSFLYVQCVTSIQIIIWLDESMFDHKILKQVGQIKLPQPWLQKKEYREKKRQIYDYKVTQHSLLTSFKQQKQQFINNIGSVQMIAGLPAQCYDDISIDSFKKLKHEGLVEKTNQIKQLQNVLSNLQVRLSSLQQKKQQYINKKISNQKRQVNQIFELKKEVSTIQQTQGMKKQVSLGLIYNRTRKSTDNRMIKTIFTNVDKKMKRMNDTVEFNWISQNRESDQKSQEVALPIVKKKAQFKNNQKKVATVVKEGHQNLQINRRQLRDDYQSEILKIDFQMEKKYSNLLQRFQEACQQLNSMMEQSEQLNI